MVGSETAAPMSPEEDERLRQLEIVRRGVPVGEPGVTGRRS